MQFWPRRTLNVFYCALQNRLHPETEKLRKVSAAPILQKAPTCGSWDDEVQFRPRSVSACIVCQRRKKRVSRNLESSVVVKTPMAKTLQEGRRFSEVLKVRAIPLSLWIACIANKGYNFLEVF